MKTWKIIYNFVFIPLATLTLPISAIFSKKIRKILINRSGLWKRVKLNIKKLDRSKKIVWFHVASAGEYLQAKPLITLFYEKKFQCIVTTTSCSGRRWLDKKPDSKLVFHEYYPFDRKSNAKKMLNLIQPDLIIFIKTDLWPNLIWEGSKLNTLMFLVNAYLSPSSSKVTSNISRGYYISLISHLTKVYTLTKKESLAYETIIPGSSKIKETGDTKYDSVLQRKKNTQIFKSPFTKKITIVLGSLDENEFSVILPTMNYLLENHSNVAVVIAPHEIKEKITQDIMNQFVDFNPVLFNNYINKASKLPKSSRVVILNTMGDLFSIYAWADITYVGGGFDSGVHNILEPGVNSSSILFGPRYSNFKEAVEMVKEKVVYPIENSTQFLESITHLLKNPKILKANTKKLNSFIVKKTGASKKVFQDINKHLSNKK